LDISLLKDAILLGRKRQRGIIIVLSEVWNKIYKSVTTFVGEEPSNFALLCFNHMKTNDRDTGRNRWKVHMESTYGK
jgi:hypothetical protein